MHVAKHSLLKFAAIVAATLMRSVVEGENAPTQYTVDFSNSDNLKAIFDAGLRPRRYLGLAGLRHLES